MPATGQRNKSFRCCDVKHIWEKISYSIAGVTTEIALLGALAALFMALAARLFRWQ